MKFTRRDTIFMGFVAVEAPLLPLPTSAALEDEITAFTGGADVMASEAIVLNAPEIAENCNTVPIDVSAPGSEAILIFAVGNPIPTAATFSFGPLSAAQEAGIRIRLAQSQNVMAIAKMPDGSFVQASREVKVTIGGCGG